MSKKEITSIGEVARLTQNEFLRAEQRFDKIDGTLKTVVDMLDLMRADIHDIKIAMGPLVRTVAALEETVRHLDKRVTRLEEKGGFGEIRHRAAYRCWGGAPFGVPFLISLDQTDRGTARENLSRIRQPASVDGLHSRRTIAYRGLRRAAMKKRLRTAKLIGQPPSLLRRAAQA